MRVARQSGGKTLFAQFDPVNVEPAVPKASCLSGTRDNFGSHLKWKAPDNGGADITSYKILRGLTAGSEVEIATYNIGPNGKPEYTDATADPAVAHYFYKIIAVNSVNPNGGPLSNEVDLPIVIPIVQDPCTVPGITLLSDAAGDSLNPAPGTDMLSASVAQPYVANAANMKLVFTIKTDPALSAVHPLGSAWYLAMKIAGDDPATPAVETVYYRGVRMEYNSTTPAGGFYYYTPGGNSSGGVDGRFVDSETPADPASNYNPTTGTITIVVAPSDLTLSVGSIISGFVAGSSQTTDPTNSLAGATEVYDPMPDSLAFAGGYTIAPNGICAPLRQCRLAQDARCGWAFRPSAQPHR